MKNHIVQLTLEREVTTPKGETKRKQETYLAQHIEVLSEAEQRALELYNGDCDVNTIKRLPESYKEIVNEQGDKPFFRATIVETYIDDQGEEKELKYNLFVRASDLTEAHTTMQHHLSQGLESMRLDSLVKTKIIDLL